jgi:hypothetical protein
VHRRRVERTPTSQSGGATCSIILAPVPAPGSGDVDLRDLQPNSRCTRRWSHRRDIISIWSALPAHQGKSSQIISMYLNLP